LLAAHAGQALKFCASEADTRFRMHVLFESEMLIGLGAVAVWTYANYPKLRPASLLRAILHVSVSFCAFALLPTLLSVLPPQTYLALVLLFPTLTYLLLSWVWLLARIIEMLGGTPRGGLPVPNQS
jgi:hypothetical protein